MSMHSEGLFMHTLRTVQLIGTIRWMSGYSPRTVSLQTHGRGRIPSPICDETIA